MLCGNGAAHKLGAESRAAVTGRPTVITMTRMDRNKDPLEGISERERAIMRALLKMRPEAVGTPSARSSPTSRYLYCSALSKRQSAAL